MKDTGAQFATSPVGNATVEKVAVPIPTKSQEPHIELLREGNIIKTIRISCRCGCEVDIECQYDAQDSQGDSQ